METNPRKFVLGLLLLVASVAILVSTGTLSSVPIYLIGLGVIGVAAGTLLVGTSEKGRPV
jgi:hypothetical protein